MSTIGRLFVFVNLVLSIVFLTCGAFLLAKSDDYRGKLNTEKQGRTADADNFKGRITTLESERNSARNDAENERVKTAQAITERDQLKIRVDAENAENTRVGAEITKISSVMGEYRKSNDDLAAQVEKYRKELDTMREERDGAKKKQEDAENLLANSQTSSKSLEDAKNALTEQMTKIQSELTGAQTALAIYAERTGISLDQVGVAPPLIEGSVIEVASDVKLIQLDVGAEANVQKGFPFSIHGGGKYKGEAIVEDVQPKFSTARIKNLVANVKVQRGDRVTTRLF